MPALQVHGIPTLTHGAAVEVNHRQTIGVKLLILSTSGPSLTAQDENAALAFLESPRLRMGLGWRSIMVKLLASSY